MPSSARRQVRAGLPRRGQGCAYNPAGIPVFSGADPGPLLEAAVTTQTAAASARDLAAENAALKATLDEYRRDFSELTSQDVTVARLRERIAQLEGAHETSVAAAVAERERVLRRDVADQERVLAEAQAVLASRTAVAEQAAAAARMATDAAQAELLDLRTRADEDAQAHAAEMEVREGAIIICTKFT
jgi:hypothetical protein